MIFIPTDKQSLKKLRLRRFFQLFRTCPALGKDGAKRELDLPAVEKFLKTQLSFN
jgi:hypothetical protein